MTRSLNFRAGLAFASVCALPFPVAAGGLERSGYNIDLLFDTGRLTVESAVTFVAPQRKLKNVRDLDPTPYVPIPSGTRGGGDLSVLPASATGSENYWASRIGVKAAIGDAADCMFDHSEPWGAHKRPTRDWAGANEDVETKLSSDSYAVTCSYRLDAGPGQIRLIGGSFYQEVSGFQEQLINGGIGRLDLEGAGWGWRAGLAYEIPEYAFRASLVYNSEVRLDDITGTLDLSQVLGVPAFDIHGAQDIPDVLELKLQSGIAPDWLAFGAIKWTDWSQLQKVPFCSAAVTGACTTSNSMTSLDLGYRDGWMVTGGLGYKFTDQWSGAVHLAWDRGTAQGFGTATDTWTLGLGAAYAPNSNIELRIFGALALLTGGRSETVILDGEKYGQRANYEFDDDIAAGVSSSLRVRF